MIEKKKRKKIRKVKGNKITKTLSFIFIISLSFLSTFFIKSLRYVHRNITISLPTLFGLFKAWKRPKKASRSLAKAIMKSYSMQKSWERGDRDNVLILGTQILGRPFINNWMREPDFSSIIYGSVNTSHWWTYSRFRIISKKIWSNSLSLKKNTFEIKRTAFKEQNCHCRRVLQIETLLFTWIHSRPLCHGVYVYFSKFLSYTL